MSSTPPGLATDLYQLTMAQGYWRSGLTNRQAIFHLSFRQAPFGGGFVVAAGIEAALDFVDSFRFGAEEIDYLSDLRLASGDRQFRADFLQHLSTMSLSCDLEAVPEGAVVFAREPVLRVSGPLEQVQLLETGLLSLVNHESLIATKGARVRLAAGRDAVLEFGLRRAPGLEGGMAATRAAFIGGCSATSNVEAGRRWQIPVRGTHGHSWVQAFGSELEAFRAFVQTMPKGAVLLVDTFDTHIGVGNAIVVAQELAARGGELGGIRLDSGDLLELSRWCRAELDRASLGSVSIVASGDLDEYRIEALKADGAPIDVWGVGTRLVTGAPDAALGGVFKLGAVRDGEGPWAESMKLSDESSKQSLPGAPSVVRFSADGQLVADGIFDSLCEEPRELAAFEWAAEIGDPRRVEGLERSRLLRSRMHQGRRLELAPTAIESREVAAEGLASLPPGLCRLRAPMKFPVGLEKSLAAKVREARLASV